MKAWVTKYCLSAGIQYKEIEAKTFNRLVTNEEQHQMRLLVTLVDQDSGEIVRGPSEVKASVYYDFVDPDANNAVAVRRHLSSLNFSLGQLDSVEGARANSNIPLHTLLARKIASAL